jgi:23S rRNA (cytidine1920-2'-O)/16S rRNA (cytidine1409-2'-O)-methyltransferase
MAIEQVVQEAKKQGLFLEELDFSPITGTKGNIEYISLFSKNKIAKEIDINFVIDMSKKLGGKYEV